MHTHRLTDTEIAIRIVPKSLRWPECGTSTTWTKAHDCIAAFKDLVRNVDLDCLQAEQKKDLSVDAIRRLRAEICDQTLSKLVNFRPFEVAEKAVIENIVSLERLTDRDPQQVQLHQNLTKALRDLREGIEATRRMVLDRCKMRESVSV